MRCTYAFLRIKTSFRIMKYWQPPT